MAWEQLISKKATVNDTVQLIVRVINEYSGGDFVRKITAALQPNTGTREDFLKRVFWYACYSAKYTMDPEGHEMIFTPERSIREGKTRGIDCKKFTTLIGAILKAAGIEPLLKVISYDGQRWEHIYIIVLSKNGYYVLDPVNHCQWNSEIPHRRGYIYFLNGTSMPDTKLSLLGKMDTPQRSFNLQNSIHIAGCNILNNLKGVGAEPTLAELEKIYTDLFSTPLPNAVINKSASTTTTTQPAPQMFGMGKLTAAQRKERRQRLLAKFKNVGLALPRVAFLTVLRMNFGKIANKLANAFTKDPSKVQALWAKVGGDPSELQKSILAGSVVTPPTIPASGSAMSGLGFAGLSAAVATATPIIIAFSKLISDLKAGSPAGATDAENEAADQLFDEQVIDPAECDGDNGYIDADLKSAAYSGNRPGAKIVELKYSPDALMQYYKDNNIDLNRVRKAECGPDTTNTNNNPTPGSFATGTIDTRSDLLNFFKAAGVFNLGAQMNGLGTPAAVGTGLALLYALRNVFTKKFTTLKIK